MEEQGYLGFRKLETVYDVYESMKEEKIAQEMNDILKLFEIQKKKLGRKARPDPDDTLGWFNWKKKKALYGSRVTLNLSNDFGSAKSFRGSSHRGIRRQTTLKRKHSMNSNQ